MHLRAKRFLRLRDIFFDDIDDNLKNIANEVIFFKKYISLYPSHLDFVEFLNFKKTTDLIYFFKIPSKKKFLMHKIEVVDLDEIL